MTKFVADVEMSFTLEELNLLKKASELKNSDIGIFVRTVAIQKAKELLKEIEVKAELDDA